MRGGIRRGARAAAAVAVCSTGVALAAGCGGESENAGASEADQRERMQEAGLKFARCMRENGVDVPDPTPGEPGIRLALDRDQAESANFRRAQEECRKHLEGARPELSEEEQAEFRDRALEFAQCMRKEGIDFPDPNFGSGGEVMQRFGEGEGPEAPGFREAAETCRPEGEGPGMFGAGPPPGDGPGAGGNGP